MVNFRKDNIITRLRPIYVLWYREILLYLRNRLRLFTSLFLPVFILLVFGSGLKYLASAIMPGYDFFHFFYPGIVVLSTMAIALMSTMSIVWDREFGFLREILVSPVPRTDIAIGKILGASTTALFQGLMLLAIAPFLGIRFSGSSLIWAIFVIFLIALVSAGIGLFLGSRVRRMETISVLSQIVIAPLAFLSGAFFPLSNMPFWLSLIARLDPLTYGVDALRFVVLQLARNPLKLSQIIAHPFFINIVALFLFAYLTVFISAMAFKRMK